MLYHRPVRELMRDAAKQLPSPTTPHEIIDWFAREYPLVKKTTAAAHIKGLTANDRNRHHYSVSRYEPIFTWTRDGSLTSMTLISTSTTRKLGLTRLTATTRTAS